MTDNQNICEHLQCEKVPRIGSIYCFKHSQEQKLRPAQTTEATQ